MIQCMDRETIIDNSQGVVLPLTHPISPDWGMPRIKTKMAATFSAYDRVGSSTVSQSTPIVFVVDDDVSVRRSFELLIYKARWQPETFESAQEFLCRERVRVPSCLVLDIALPGLNCLELQKRLAVDRKDMSIIFVADHCDVGMTVQAMKMGAFDFFTKPFCDNTLLSTMRQAIEHSKTVLDHEVEKRGLLDCYASLSCREREVMALVVSGLLNKQVGFELGISEITVKSHRGRVMQKMKAASFADLVKMAMEIRASDVA
jgi:FixJ family two-component response regulator